MRNAHESLSRRDAVSRMGGFLMAAALSNWRWSRAFPHPDPRPGITAENVLPDDKLPDKKRVREGFAAAREYPELFDGIYCACECSKTHRSLLTCFESLQPTGCMGCQEVAELVSSMAKEGKALQEIRAAVDKKWDD
jgi:hypothetical protein